MTCLRRIVPGFSSIALAALLLAGCGGEKVVMINQDPESKPVSDVVEEFNEANQDVKKAVKLFSAGSMPKGAEFKKYGKYSYMTTGTVKTAGDTATMDLTIREEATGKDTDKIVWTFKKEADRWKIVTAPLP